MARAKMTCALGEVCVCRRVCLESPSDPLNMLGHYRKKNEVRDLLKGSWRLQVFFCYLRASIAPSATFTAVYPSAHCLQLSSIVRRAGSCWQRDGIF